MKYLYWFCASNNLFLQDGIMLPNIASLYLAPIDNSSIFTERQELVIIVLVLLLAYFHKQRGSDRYHCFQYSVNNKFIASFMNSRQLNYTGFNWIDWVVKEDIFDIKNWIEEVIFDFALNRCLIFLVCLSGMKWSHDMVSKCVRLSLTR